MGVLPRIVLKLEGAPAAKAVMERGPSALRRLLLRVLRFGGSVVVKRAKLNMTANRSVNTGAARASLTYSVDDTPGAERAIIGTVLAVKGTAAATAGRVDYPFFIEAGRAAGRMPPRNVLRQWIRRRMGVSDEASISRAEFFLRRAISRKGVSARPFLAPALLESEPEINAYLQAEGERMIDQLDGKGPS